LVISLRMGRQGRDDDLVAVRDTLRPPIALMRATSIHEWPAGTGWRVEPKFDGWRCAVFVDQRRVQLQSRHGRDLTSYFPEVAAAAGSLPAGTVVDGELVTWRDGRIDFAGLGQHVIGRRQHPPPPASLVVFDVLQHPDGVVTQLPLARRRDLLVALLAGADPGLALCPHADTWAAAEEWMTWGAVGVEGVVIKAARSRYRIGGTGWYKRRSTELVDLVIGGITGTAARPRTLLLGTYRDGQLWYVGRTVPLRAEDAAILSQLLDELADASESITGWPNPLPGRWMNLTATEPVAYQPVPPIVVEVIADTAFDQSWFRYRHPLRLYRIRTDL
jgi:ATP-dependent DNA ligase